MADQGKWFKLWESALDDHDLENLTVHEWFCWARFGTYLKKHGRDGKIRIRHPATALIHLFRSTDFQGVLNMLKCFPNYVVEEGQNVTANVTNESVTYNIRCLNWTKYQGDFSGDRVRKYRQRVTANVTAQEEKRSRREVEEKYKHLTVEPASPPSENGKLVQHYKIKLGILPDDKAWDKKFWGRSAKAAAEILENIGGLHDAISFVDYWAKKFREKDLSWTIETISKRAVEWKSKERAKDAKSTSGTRIYDPEIVRERNKDAHREGTLAPVGQVLSAFRGLESSQAPTGGTKNDDPGGSTGSNAKDVD